MKEYKITTTSICNSYKIIKYVEAETEEEAIETWGNSDCNGEIENVTVEEASDE